MSGLNSKKPSRNKVGWSKPKIDFQRFTSSATYTKPGDVSIMWIECIGAGGSGGSGSEDTNGMAAGGGGGGAFAWACFPQMPCPQP